MPCRFSFDPKEVNGVTIFPAQEPAALDSVLDEKAGEFFAWCVQGAVRCYREGITDEPPAVLKAIACFFSQEDPVAQFFEQAPIHFTGHQSDGVSLKDLANLWVEEGFGQVTARTMGRMLRGRSDKCKYCSELDSCDFGGGSGKARARGVRGWRLA